MLKNILLLNFIISLIYSDASASEYTQAFPVTKIFQNTGTNFSNSNNVKNGTLIFSSIHGESKLFTVNIDKIVLPYKYTKTILTTEKTGSKK